MKIVKDTIKKQASRWLVLALSTMMTMSLLGACVTQNSNESTVPVTSGTGNTSGTEVTESTVDADAAVRQLTDDAIHLALAENENLPPNWLAGHEPKSSEDSELESAIREFSRKSFELMAEGHSEANLLMSPLSIYVDLAMLGEGTAGKTREEISTALAGSAYQGEGDFLEYSRQAISKLLEGMNMSRQKFDMRVGQSLWFRPDIPIRDSYLDLLENNYFTEVFSADFAGNPEEVQDEIGDWVSAKTAGLLGDKLPMTIKPSDVMYLLQTLYFKDSWLMPFNEDVTEPGIFRLADGSTQELPLMRQSLLPAWGYKGESYQASDLLTEQGYSFRVILPDEILDLNAALEMEGIYDVLFSDHQTGLNSSEYWAADWQVNWQVPRFDVKADIDIKELLGKLGVNEVMGGSADFSVAADVGPGAYFLDTAKQQVRIKADEKGLEAAAVTILGATESMPMLQGELDMTLDRPFLFSIAAPSGLPLFIAWVGDVSAE